MARGIAPAIGALSGLIVWALHFTAIYAATATACDRGGEAMRWLGMPLIPALAAVTTAAALAALALVTWLALRQTRPGGLLGPSRLADPGFLAWVALATSGLAAVGIVFEALPAFVVYPCFRGAG